MTTPADVDPTHAVIQTDVPERPPDDVLTKMEKEAVDLLMQGEADMAMNVVQQVKAARALPDRVVVRAPTADEAALAATTADEWVAGALDRLRFQRDAMLRQTDFTVVPDATWDTAPWHDYREALRNLPDTVQDPQDPTWPTPPDVPAVPGLVPVEDKPAA